MAEQHSAKQQQAAARRQLRRWLPITGIILLLMGLYISAFLIPDAIEIVNGPQHLSLAKAADVAHAERTYARIEDGRWECETLRQVRGVSASTLRYGRLREETRYSEVFFTDSSGEVVVFVTLSGDVDCADLAEQRPTGYLYTMRDGTRRELTDEARLARYFEADTFLEFCGYCGQENSLIGAVFGVAFLGSGLVMIITGRKIRV